MKNILLAAMVGSALLLGSALADDAYPRSVELIAAQTELDAVTRFVSRSLRKAIGAQTAKEDREETEACVFIDQRLRARQCRAV